MRRRAKKDSHDEPTEKEMKPEMLVTDDLSMDDEIKRLEAELALDDDSDDSDDDDSQPDDVICLSKTDRITPLPSNQLPQNKRKFLKVDGALMSSTTGAKKPKQSKHNATSNEDEVSEGLRATVKELLDGYVARSSEKIPFYCRVCAHQSSDEEEFLAHQTTELHLLACSTEKKASFCRLCRKQFTSLVQLKEHLVSRPHRNKMDETKARQRGGGRGGRGGRGMSYGAGRGSQRQWC